MKYKKSIIWFRQDMRVQDNTALFEAVQNSMQVLPIFILDTNLIPKFGGLSDKKFGFIREALDALAMEIRKLGGSGIEVFYGNPTELIPELAKKNEIEKVFANRTYGQYGTQRDTIVTSQLESLGIEFELYKDFLLVEPHEVEQRKVFTPFYKLWQKVEFSTKELTITSISQLKISDGKEARDFITLKKHPYFTMDFGKQRFEKHICAGYDDVRNNLDVDGTSRLSVYLRFGIFSVRQIYNKAKQVNDHFISEMAWREFWHHIIYYFPNTREEEFLEKRRAIEWSHDEYLFEKWCKGETGYPIVDAAMKQLNETNWMHGRARMVVASFLTKDLHIDWRWGEQYFKEKLLDYDEAVNLGNWQWSASVGADPKPLRIFSPLLQSKKFDTEAKYIRKYIPELAFTPVKEIHDPIKYKLENYHRIIVDHSEEQKITKEIYKKAQEI